MAKINFEIKGFISIYRLLSVYWRKLRQELETETARNVACCLAPHLLLSYIFFFVQLRPTCLGTILGSSYVNEKSKLSALPQAILRKAITQLRFFPPRYVYIHVKLLKKDRSVFQIEIITKHIETVDKDSNKNSRDKIVIDYLKSFLEKLNRCEHT